MRSRDVIQLFDIVGSRARVTILNQPLAAMVPNLHPSQPAESDSAAAR